MARSRYATTPVINSRYYATFNDPTRRNFLGTNLLEGTQTVDHVFSDGERLDTLSSKYYGDSQYWWVIAMANRVGFALSIEPGTILKIPLSIEGILSKIQR